MWFSQHSVYRFVLLLPSYAVVKEAALGLSMPVQRLLMIVILLALLKRKQMYAAVHWYFFSRFTSIVFIFGTYIHVFLFPIKLDRHWYRRHQRNSCVKIVSLKGTSASFVGNWAPLIHIPVLRYKLLQELSCYLNGFVSILGITLLLSQPIYFQCGGKKEINKLFFFLLLYLTDFLEACIQLF